LQFLAAGRVPRNQLTGNHGSQRSRRRNGNGSGVIGRLSVRPQLGRLAVVVVNAGAAALIFRAGAKRAATATISSEGIP
jgi:hypothetical protein